MVSVYHLEFPPLGGGERVRVLSDEEWRKVRQFPKSDCSYQETTVGPGGEYPTMDALLNFIEQENRTR